MRINPINPFFAYKNNYKSPKLNKGLPYDVFQKSQVSFRGVPFGVDKSYLKESSFDNQKFKQIPKCIKKAARESVFAGKLTKEIYDKKYGENNYVVVSIGTSPAGIGKALEYMGVDVRYVPISSLSGLIGAGSYQKFFKGQKDSSKYRKFLDSIGLNNKSIKKDKRNYVAIDYTATGDSIMSASDIARCYLSIKSPNLIFNSINETLTDAMFGDLYDKYNHKDRLRLDKYIVRYMQEAEIGDYCGIPHIPCDSLGNIDNCLKESKSKDAKDFEFALCHYLKRGKNED